MLDIQRTSSVLFLVEQEISWVDRERFAWRCRTRADLTGLVREVLGNQVSRVARNRWSLTVPVSLRPFESYGRMHFHQGFEMPIQCSGRGRWELVDGEVPLPNGTILLFPRGVAHKEHVDESVGHNCNVNLYVGPDAVTYHPLVRPPLEDVEVGPGRPSCVLRFESVGLLFDMCGELVSEVERSGRTDTPLVRGLLLAILSMILENLEAPRESAPPHSRLVNRCRQEALRYLCSTSLNVAWLAERLGCSADYLSHVFRRETGRRLASVINEERVKLAKYLLQSSAMSVGEVALSCGYADPNYFARVFKRWTDVTPREFRASSG
jgi:AraC-like DNA-binding protein